MDGALEERIQRLRERGDLSGAATQTIEGYGPEVLGFLITMLRDEIDGREVFSQACEDLWRGLPSFHGRCSMCTWFFVLARHAASRYRQSPHRRPGRHVGLTDAGEIAASARTATERYLRTSVKDRFAVLRDSLSEDDRALLVLRVDRGLSWVDVSRAFADDESPDALQKTAARLRKRFQLLRERIRALAAEEGLLGSPDT
jgi:RNA polymerase sigma-70 factor (ECF subfamily)